MLKKRLQIVCEDTNEGSESFVKTQMKAWGFKNLACLPCRIPIYRNIQQGPKLEHYESDNTLWTGTNYVFDVDFRWFIIIIFIIIILITDVTQNN